MVDIKNNTGDVLETIDPSEKPNSTEIRIVPEWSFGEPKESKSNKHFQISLVKSILRIAACFVLYNGNIEAAALILAGAEILGIAEEI